MVTKVVPGLLIATSDAAEAAREASARMTKALREAIEKRYTLPADKPSGKID